MIRALKICLLIVAAAMAVAAFSANEQEKEKKPPRNFDVKADLMKMVWGAERKVLLTGNVIFTQEDTKITSEKVEWDRTQETAVFPGKMTVTNQEGQVDAEKGQVFFKTRVAILEGAVKVLYYPKDEKPEGDKDSVQSAMHKETTITCSRLEYDYKNKIATATGDVTIRQPERTVTAQKVVFDQQTELITLNGDVKVVDDEGQELFTPGEAIISIKKGEEWIEAPNPTAKFKVEIDD